MFGKSTYVGGDNALQSFWLLVVTAVVAISGGKLSKTCGNRKALCVSVRSAIYNEMVRIQGGRTGMCHDFATKPP